MTRTGLVVLQFPTFGMDDKGNEMPFLSERVLYLEIADSRFALVQVHYVGVCHCLHGIFSGASESNWTHVILVDFANGSTHCNETQHKIGL